MSVQFAAVAATFNLILTFILSPSAAVDLNIDEDLDRDYCTAQVSSRAVKPNVRVREEEFYFCHPTIPNAYLKCVVGRPKASDGKIAYTEIIEEKELVCGVNAFFNSQKKACMPHPLSDCARRFVQHRPSNEQRLCDAYRRSRPANYSAVASLICHDKEKQQFVVCPVNSASAVIVPCVNGTYFNQRLGRCMQNESSSDCPIEWKEMERESNPKAGEMRQPALSECICKASLARCGDPVVYVADPKDSSKFLICVRGGQIHRGDCPPDKHWSDNLGACCDNGDRKPIPECVAKPPAPPKTPSPDQDGQHECIDCVISARQKCECRKALAATGKTVAYICDPDAQDRFLVCTSPDRVVCQPCPKGTAWNSGSQACDTVRKCDPWMCSRAPKPTTTTTTTTPCKVPHPHTTACAQPKPPVTTRAPVTTPPCTTTVPPTLPPPPPYCEYFYEFHPEKMNWYSAKRVCEANHGSLATIPDLNTQQLLRDRYGSTSSYKRVWIGASDRNREGTWEWVTGERFGFTNWYRNQPSYKRDEDCLQFNYYEKGAWSDEDCDLDKSFICQHLVCMK